MKNPISKGIMHVRKSAGLSQREFSDLFDVSRPTIAQIELGNNKPSLNLLSKIIIKFDVDANYFFKENIDIEGKLTVVSDNNHQYNDNDTMLLQQENKYLIKEIDHLNAELKLRDELYQMQSQIVDYLKSQINNK